MKKAENDTGPDGDFRPGLLGLSIFKIQSYIIDFSMKARILLSGGRPAAPVFHPVRSAPHSRMGHGLGQRNMAKQTAQKSAQKQRKTVQITQICTAVSCVEEKDAQHRDIGVHI